MRDQMIGIQRGAAFLDSRIAKRGIAGAVGSALRDWPKYVATVPHAYDVTVRLLNGGDLEPEVIRWLWDGWLARGKLHVMAGAPGTGKTTIALALAATISTGGRFPLLPAPTNFTFGGLLAVCFCFGILCYALDYQRWKRGLHAF